MEKKCKFNKRKKEIIRMQRKISRLKLLATKGDTNAKYEAKMWSDILGNYVSKTKFTGGIMNE